MTQQLEDLVDVVRGPVGPEQVRAAARLMSLLEDDPDQVHRLRRIAADTRPALVVGVTGPPGAGKSTLTDALVTCARKRDKARRIGVIAVDPSSPFSGGAVLGDRVRMMRHATDESIFIRSLATRGHLGGVSRGARGVIAVMRLLGCEIILVETVGVGQSEIEVAQLADIVVIVLAPGQGDGVQLLKAGLMEIGDLFIVNKADRDGAGLLNRQLTSALQMGLGKRATPGHFPSGAPAVLMASATEQQGIDEIMGYLEQRAEAGVS